MWLPQTSIEAISHDNVPVVTFMYADDMVIGSRNKEHLQLAFNRLQVWAKDNDLIINKEKTVQMVFRKGGRLAITDPILFGKDKLKIVNHCNYLGIRLQATRTSFKMHVKEKVIAAIRAFQDIIRPELLDLQTAHLLFNSKIAPIAPDTTYFAASKE